MSYVIQTRRDTAANWTSVNPVLHAGESGQETDTGKRKSGDGVTAWNSLAYLPSNIATTLTGFVSGAGTVTAADSILGAFQKIDGNTATKIGGSTGATDRAVIIANGTGGVTEQASGVIISSTNTISNFGTTFNNQTGTTYTLVTADMGKTITLNNASAITLTLPNSFQVGFTCEIIQLGAGQVTVTAAAGATVSSYTSLVKLAGQNAAARLVVTSNSGTNAVYNLAGNLA